MTAQHFCKSEIRNMRRCSVLGDLMSDMYDSTALLQVWNQQYWQYDTLWDLLSEMYDSIWAYHVCKSEIRTMRQCSSLGDLMSGKYDSTALLLVWNQTYVRVQHFARSGIRNVWLHRTFASLRSDTYDSTAPWETAQHFERQRSTTLLRVWITQLLWRHHFHHKKCRQCGTFASLNHKIALVSACSKQTAQVHCSRFLGATS